MNKLNYSQEALRDLDEIRSYISEEFKNSAAANNTVNSILDNIENLKNFPELGSLLSAVNDIESDYRFLICGNYIAFYRTKSKEINIDRILYGKRNYLRILFENLPPPKELQE